MNSCIPVYACLFYERWFFIIEYYIYLIFFAFSPTRSHVTNAQQLLAGSKPPDYMEPEKKLFYNTHKKPVNTQSKLQNVIQTAAFLYPAYQT